MLEGGLTCQPLEGPESSALFTQARGLSAAVPKEGSIEVISKLLLAISPVFQQDNGTDI